ncbi:MAG: hypothetical protein ACI8Y7_000426 [Candidatus Woesearchaeota archaeon]|jgi:hypothetical protein
MTQAITQLEVNISRSFRKVKDDVAKLQKEIAALQATQKSLIRQLDKPKTIVKKVSTRKKITFIAAKTGKKFHNRHCPFAKNIKPKSRVVFKSIETARNNGFKPCSCVK